MLDRTFPTPLKVVILAAITAVVLGQDEVSVPTGYTVCSVNADIIFVVDASTSVGEDNFRTQLKWAADVTDHFQLAPSSPYDAKGARFGAVVYSYSVEPLFGLGYLDTPEILREALETAPYLAESSRTHAALRTVLGLDLFSEYAGGHHDAKDIVVLISDGRSSYHMEARLASHELQSAGVTVMAAGLHEDPDVVALRQLASSNDDVFVLGESATDRDLADLALALAQRICNVVSPSYEIST